MKSKYEIIVSNIKYMRTTLYCVIAASSRYVLTADMVVCLCVCVLGVWCVLGVCVVKSETWRSCAARSFRLHASLRTSKAKQYHDLCQYMYRVVVSPIYSAHAHFVRECGVCVCVQACL